MALQWGLLRGGASSVRSGCGRWRSRDVLRVGVEWTSIARDELECRGRSVHSIDVTRWREV